jgi:hypothetical protein
VAISRETTDTNAVTLGYPDVAGTLGGVAGNAVTHNYIPQLYGKKVLYDFYASTVWKEVTNTDYEGQFKSAGESIQIRMAPAITTNNYTKGLGITYEVPADDSIEMTIAYAKYQAFRVDDVDKVQMDVDLMNMYAQDASERLQIQVDADVLQAMATGVHASNTGATAGVISGSLSLGTAAGDATNIEVDRTNALDKLVDLNTALDEQNIPQAGRFVIIPAWYANRLKLSDLKAADFSGDNTGMVRTGLIGSIDGMKVFVNNNLYTATAGGGGSETNYYVVAGVKMATSFALQLSKMDTLKIPESFGEYWRTLWVYGIKVVRSEGVSLLICNPN